MKEIKNMGPFKEHLTTSLKTQDNGAFKKIKVKDRKLKI